MSRILRFLFPTTRYTARASLFLLALRVLFGVLLLSHGIAKVDDFAALSEVFPDPLGLGSRISLTLAIFGELFCSVGFIVGAFYRLALIPMIFTIRRPRRRSLRREGTRRDLPLGLRPDVYFGTRQLCARPSDRRAAPQLANATQVNADRPVERRAGRVSPRPADPTPETASRRCGV